MKKTNAEIEGSAIKIIYKDIRNKLLYIRGVDETDTWKLFNAIGNKVLNGTGSELCLSVLPFGIYLLEVKGELHRVIK